MQNLKKVVAKAAMDYVEEGMVIGCGSGTTAMEFLDLLSKSLFKDSLVCVPTSNVVRKYLEKKGVNIKEVEEVDKIDLGVDGADKVELDTGVAIKGGGGAHVLEKKVAEKCMKYVVIVDYSKIVNHFDGIMVPLEVEADYLAGIVKSFEKIGLNFSVRDKFADSGNMLLDVQFRADLLDMNLYEFDEKLKSTDGVVGNGIFMDQMDECLVSYEGGSVRSFEF